MAPQVVLLKEPYLGPLADLCLNPIQTELDWATLDWNRPEVCEQASGHQILFGSGSTGKVLSF